MTEKSYPASQDIDDKLILSHFLLLGTIAASNTVRFELQYDGIRSHQ